MVGTLEDIAKKALAAARRAGAGHADALAVKSDSLSVEVRSGALEHAERSEAVEIGLRVLIGHRQACVAASDTRDATLADMAERAVAMAREAPEDPYCGLAGADQLARDTDASGLELADPSEPPAAADLQRDALQAEAAAAGVKGVSMVDASGTGWGRTAIHIAATNGFSGGYERTSRSVSCVAISGEGLGMERDYCVEGRIFSSDLPTAEEIGRRAGERAAARAGARKPPTGAFPVLFDERIAGTLVGHVVAAINGAAVVRGASWLKDAMGETILPDGLSLIEDPFRKRVSGSRPFDVEGLPTARRAIIENGILKSWMLDLASARKLGLDSTANASRGTSAPPSPSAGNLTLDPEGVERDTLIAEMGTGLIVTSLIGSAVNPTTGDYSRGASGFWVENGEVAGPVNECTVAGNLRDMLRRIRPANDARRYLSRVVPSLLVEGLTIAGT
ncbi:MAG: TldD/PmbA family protein [Paracoccaceae bacterium]